MKSLLAWLRRAKPEREWPNILVDCYCRYCKRQLIYAEAYFSDICVSCECDHQEDEEED